MELSETEEFKTWFNAQISSRLSRIQLSNHFGDHKLLGENLAELRWKSGRRIYFTIYESNGRAVLLLLGGYKNAQTKDIKKAKALLKKYKKES